MKLLKILVLLLLVHSLTSQEIVDYSYTASIQKSHLNSNKKYDINISADRLDP